MKENCQRLLSLFCTIDWSIDFKLAFYSSDAPASPPPSAFYHVILLVTIVTYFKVSSSLVLHIHKLYRNSCTSIAFLEIMYTKSIYAQTFRQYVGNCVVVQTCSIRCSLNMGWAGLNKECYLHFRSLCHPHTHTHTHTHTHHTHTHTLAHSHTHTNILLSPL